MADKDKLVTLEDLGVAYNDNGNKISDLKSALDKTAQPMDLIEQVDGKYITTTGESTSANFEYYKYAIPSWATTVAIKSNFYGHARIALSCSDEPIDFSSDPFSVVYPSSNIPTATDYETSVSCVGYRYVYVSRYKAAITEASAIAYLKERVTNIGNTVTQSQIAESIDLSTYTAGYITYEGAVSTNTDLGRVDGIKLRKGSKITVLAKGTSGVVAMIYRCNEVGTYTALVVANETAVKEYSYTATEDMIVGVSFFLNSIRVANKVMAVESALSAIQKDTSDILDEAQITEDIDLTGYTVGYIAYNGNISTNTELGRVGGIKLRKGSTLTLLAKGATDNVAMIYRCNTDGSYTALVVAVDYTVRKYTYTATENMTVGVSFYLDRNRMASKILAIDSALDAVSDNIITNYIDVGTGKTYTDIKTAIASIINPTEKNRYIVRLYEGQYNTFDSSLLANDYYGLVIPDYTDIIGIGNRDDIVLYFRGTSETSQYNNNISAINVGGHNTFENITIIGKHCRYAVHDDFLAQGETHEIYNNVRFVVEEADSSAFEHASSNTPYGVSAEIMKTLDFNNCIFENGCITEKPTFFYHDTTAAAMIRGSIINFVNCRFVDGLYSIWITNYNTPKESRIYLYGCKADNPVFVRGNSTDEDTVFFSGYANVGFTFTGDGSISQEDIEAHADLMPPKTEKVTGTTPSITGVADTRYICGEVSTLTITAPESGIIDVTFTSGSTATVLTVTSAKANTTIKWANGFDPTSLDANTTYEIRIMDGELGAALLWT